MEKQKKITHSEKEKAKKIRDILKNPQHTIKQLDNAIPFDSEVVAVIGCLIDMLKEELDNSKKAGQQYRECLNSIIQVLNDCLKDNKIDSEERTRIINALDSLSKSWTEFEKEREKQSGKTKRFIVGAISLLFGLILIPFKFKEK